MTASTNKSAQAVKRRYVLKRDQWIHNVLLAAGSIVELVDAEAKYLLIANRISPYTAMGKSAIALRLDLSKSFLLF